MPDMSVTHSLTGFGRKRPAAPPSQSSRPRSPAAHLAKRLTGGRSPRTVALACLHWATHAANAPFQTKDLVSKPGGISPLNKRMVAFTTQQWLDLDLVPGNSLIKWLVAQGRTVFAIFWPNPGPDSLPACMHITYLRRLYLHNEVAEGRFAVAGPLRALNDIKLPIFVVGTKRDHIARWGSVVKLHLLNNGQVTFVLTSDGDNAGIVSESGHPHRHFRLRLSAARARTLGPHEWEQNTTPQDGSWWMEWNK